MLDDFTTSDFTADGVTHPVHRGGTGPGVVIIHEIPGITPAVAGFAERVAAAGFSVALPELFGTLGKDLSGGYLAGQLARACISRVIPCSLSASGSPVSGRARSDAGISSHRDSMSATPIASSMSRISSSVCGMNGMIVVRKQCACGSSMAAAAP